MDSLAVRRFDSAAEFWRRAGGFLLEREAEHNLIIGIVLGLMDGTTVPDQPPYLATVERDGAVVAVAMRTPPHNLVLSQGYDEAALAALADEVAAVYPSLPGVSGPKEAARGFTEAWRERTGRVATLSMAQRLYRLERVRPPVGVGGRLRRGEPSDRELLLRWLGGFGECTGAPGTAEDYARLADSFLGFQARGVYFWEDGQPVSMTGYTGKTPNGVRVSAVYTPPEHRRRGYAGACVAAVSQLLLDEGRRFCILYTDLANPTSNHIYQEVGYEPVLDVDMYRF